MAIQTVQKREPLGYKALGFNQDWWFHQESLCFSHAKRGFMWHTMRIYWGRKTCTCWPSMRTAWMAVEHAPVTRKFSHQPNNVDLPKQNWLPSKDKRGHQHQCITCVFRNGKPSKLKHNAFCIPKSQISVKKKFKTLGFTMSHHLSPAKIAGFLEKLRRGLWLRCPPERSEEYLFGFFGFSPGRGSGTWKNLTPSSPSYSRHTHTHIYIYIHICDVPMLYV